MNIDAAYQSVSELKAAIPFIDADNDQLYPDENGNFHVPSHVKKIVIRRQAMAQYFMILFFIINNLRDCMF